MTIDIKEDIKINKKLRKYKLFILKGIVLKNREYKKFCVK
jgi:hypothetical protein